MNSYAVATVTAILSQLVQTLASQAVDGAVSSIQRPDNMPAPSTPSATPNRVNVFLFQVGFDPSFRNLDLPTRDRQGSPVQRPCAALQLHYLLSFYGEEAKLAPQRMLAAVVAGLHARPLISMKRAEQFIQDASGDSNYDYLKASTLSQQGEPVRFTPASFNLEELSKLWSVFFQVPYALSVSYKASVVLVEAEESTRSALPVRTPVVSVSGDFTPMTVTEICPEGGGPTSPIFSDSVLIIRGAGFVGGALEVRVGELEPAPVVSPDAPDRLRLKLGGLSLPAGPQVIQVARPGGARANPFGFALRPRVLAQSEIVVALDATPTPHIQVKTDVTLKPDQVVTILLDGLDDVEGERPSAALPVAARAAEASTVIAPRNKLPAGRYLVRLRVDGVDSPLDAGDAPADPSYTGPLLVLT